MKVYGLSEYYVDGKENAGETVILLGYANMNEEKDMGSCKASGRGLEDRMKSFYRDLGIFTMEEPCFFAYLICSRIPAAIDSRTTSSHIKAP